MTAPAPTLPASDALPLGDSDALRKIAAERLAALTEQQARFAAAYAIHGDHVRAASEAGYSDEGGNLRTLAHRVRRLAHVQAAVKVLVALRNAESAFPDVGAVTRLLEGMLDVSVDDFLIRNATGDVCGVRDMATLGPAQRARLKKLEAKIRRSAKGERSHVIAATVELTPVLEVVDRLAKLNSWYGDEGGVTVNVQALEATIGVQSPRVGDLLAELADAVLDDGELRRFVGSSEDTERAALLRGGIARLRVQSQALALPANAPTEGS